MRPGLRLARSAVVALLVLDGAGAAYGLARDEPTTPTMLAPSWREAPAATPALAEAERFLTAFVAADGRVVGHVIGTVDEALLRDGVAAAESGRPVGADEGGERRPVR